MATTMTKQQAEDLLADYKTRLYAAAEEAIAAYDRKLKSELADEEADNARRQQEQRETARAKYSANAVKALTESRRLKEQLARRGLTRSGTAKAALSAVSENKRAADATVSAAKTKAVSALQQSLVTARNKAQQASKVNAANTRKTVENKVAEKRLTLMKGTVK